MKKISFLLIMFLFTSIAAADICSGNQNEDDEIVFLSLTKTAEPLKDLGTNLTVITEQEIREKNAKTLGDVVDGEAGISYKSYGPLGQTQSVFMRGSTAGQVLVLVDGRRVNDIGTGGGADFTAIPANIIEKVEIIRGSGSAMYGTGAFGGVINVITKKASPSTPKINPYFSFGTFNTVNAGITGAYANDVFSLLAAPSLLSSDGYRKNSFYDSKNIFAKFSVNPDEKSEIILSGQAYNADFGNPGSVSFSSLTAKQFENNNYLKIDYFTKAEDFDIQISGYSADNSRKAYDITGNPWNDYGTKYNTLNTGIKSVFTYKHLVSAGVEWDKTTYKQENIISGTEQINRNRENTACYLQAVFNIGKLTLIPVVRADQNTDYEDVSTSALSAIFRATDEIKISANTSKVWNAPSFGQIYGDNTYYIANPDLKPEKGVSSDIGVEYSKDKFSAALTGFYITTEDLIQNIDTGGWIYQAQNVDESRQYGYEIECAYDMSKEIKHKLNYTYLRAEDTKLKRDLTYRPMHNINYTLTVVPVKALKVTAGVSYVTTIMNEYRNYMNDYCLVDVKADYRITENISVWAKCDNLTNEKYQLSYGYPMSGITGYSGIEIKF
jgi:outer membrane cobalamin receptor